MAGAAPGEAGPYDRCSPARRGLAVRELRQTLPLEARDQIAEFLQRRDGEGARGAPDLLEDLHDACSLAAVRGWVASRNVADRPDAVATVGACYVQDAWRAAPALTAGYIRQCTAAVAGVVRRVERPIRLRTDTDVRAALRGDPAAQLSVFGPLAIFFLRATAEAQLPWEILVDPSRVPRPPRPFAWVPMVDGLSATLRLLLIGQDGRALKRNALLYSPLARYLLELGLVERVAVLRGHCVCCGRGACGERCGHCGGDVRRTVQRWLLAKAYLAGRCRSLVRDGRAAMALDAPYPNHGAWLDGTERDDRTCRRAAPPDEVFQQREAIRTARHVARQMLAGLVGGRHGAVKKLALWADTAEVSDPGVFLRHPLPDDPCVWDALVDALFSGRVADRASRVQRINQRLPHLARQFGVRQCTPLTGGQLGTYLCRLRDEFTRAFEHAWGPVDAL